MEVKIPSFSIPKLNYFPEVAVNKTVTESLTTKGVILENESVFPLWAHQACLPSHYHEPQHHHFTSAKTSALCQIAANLMVSLSHSLPHSLSLSQSNNISFIRDILLLLFLS
ncbi:hypothetical protein Nepgr_011388 [Nepenthes gracilis]|uniref:Uncharacterized protein n=1 Tax=Nepenthes gracilis TaxID=150966 RepID=A0AAD3SE91_NEPGR|nr:hypothetical protein Nepgr_011388 [Nepenthes gracilis]